MTFKIIWLWSDILLFILCAAFSVLVAYSLQKPNWQGALQTLLKRPSTVITGLILSIFLLIGLLDSMHFQREIKTTATNEYTTPKSVLDVLLAPLGQQAETSYSAPFATHLYTKTSTITADGHWLQQDERLHYIKQDLTTPGAKWLVIFKIIASGLLLGACAWLFVMSLWFLRYWYRSRSLQPAWQHFYPVYYSARKPIYWALLTLFIFFAITFLLSREFHILGTDKVGQDVWYLTLKSIRTAIVIGTVTTLLTLPFALLFGLLAGYFGGWVDDGIQYLYTTLSSIPGVLLIAAAVLSLQLFIANHPELFPTALSRADARLLALCIILGLTSWTGLCRLVRGEVLKLRELEFVQAAKTLGANNWQIMNRHLTPNLMHIVLITLVLDFSGLVLAEAVLSYVGVGVDPTTISFGNLINAARLELARDPIVWWPLFASFTAMLILVLCANFFADAVRAAFDPRGNQ